jgi:tetratricopeptide (TPR) repeat protein
MRRFNKVGLLSLGMLISGASFANEISPDFLKTELALAYSQYLDGSQDTGLYALNALARILESDKSAALQAEVGVNNLAFTYLRLGLLYEKAGNQLQADTYFNKALNSYQGEEIEIAELKIAVLKLDKKSN